MFNQEKNIILSVNRFHFREVSFIYDSLLKFPPMKKLVLIVLILSSMTSKAEWLKATLTFKDSTVKTGYVKYFDNAQAGKVSFKPGLGDKSVNIPSEELRIIEMHRDNGKTIKLRYIHPAQLFPFSSEMKIDKKRYWFGSVYEGDFNVLSVNITSANGAYMSQGSTSTDNYYINWPGEDYAMLSSIVAGGLTIVVGNKKMMKKTNRLIFRGKCDKMLEEFDNETFNPKKIEEVIEYYEKNCGSKSKSGNP